MSSDPLDVSSKEDLEEMEADSHVHGLEEVDAHLVEELFHKYAKRRVRRTKEGNLESFYLTRRQTRKILRILGNRLTRKEFDEILSRTGVDGRDRLVSLEEFTRLFDAERLRLVFDKMDLGHNGQITQDDLREILEGEVGITISADDLSDMFRDIDTNADGKVDFEEFYQKFKFVPFANVKRVGRTWASVGGIDWGLDHASFILPDIDRFVNPSSKEFFKFFITGGIASVFSRTLTAPLERLKLQAQTEGLASSMFSELSGIVKTEGWRGLFAGNLTNCLRVFPTTAIGCMTYVSILNTLGIESSNIDPQHRVRDLSIRIAAGATGGMVATYLTYPLDIIRTRLTLNMPNPDEVSNSKIIACGRDIVKQEGIRGLFKGSAAAIMSIGPFIMVQNGMFSLLKTMVQEEFGWYPTTNSLLAYGAVSGFVAQVSVYPLDVVRRRMQLSMVEEGWSTWKVMKDIMKSEGLRGLYQGILPTALKVAPAVAISLTVRDTVRPYFS